MSSVAVMQSWTGRLVISGWLGLSVAPASVLASRPSSERAMRLAEARPLRSAYRLEVRDLPPPLILDPLVLVESAGCPVEVRAIIRGDALVDDFAVLGSGAESLIAAAGEGVSTRYGWFVVVTIGADQVVLRRGEQTVSCALGDSETAAAPRRQSTR